MLSCWLVENELKDSHLLLARGPPSFLLDVLHYGRHWGLSRWRLVQYLLLYVTARPATKAPVTALYLRGRRCTAAPNGRQPTTNARTATSVAPGTTLMCQPGTLRIVMWRC